MDTTLRTGGIFSTRIGRFNPADQFAFKMDEQDPTLVADPREPDLAQVLDSARTDMSIPNLLDREEYVMINNQIVRKAHGSLYERGFDDPYREIRDKINNSIAQGQGEAAQASLSLSHTYEGHINQLPKDYTRFSPEVAVMEIVDEWSRKGFDARQMANNVQEILHKASITNPGPDKDFQTQLGLKLSGLLGTSQLTQMLSSAGARYAHSIKTVPGLSTTTGTTVASTLSPPPPAPGAAGVLTPRVSSDMATQTTNTASTQTPDYTVAANVLNDAATQTLSSERGAVTRAVDAIDDRSRIQTTPIPERSRVVPEFASVSTLDTSGSSTSSTASLKAKIISDLERMVYSSDPLVSSETSQPIQDSVSSLVSERSSNILINPRRYYFTIGQTAYLLSISKNNQDYVRQMEDKINQLIRRRKISPNEVSVSDELKRLTESKQKTATSPQNINETSLNLSINPETQEKSRVAETPSRFRDARPSTSTVSDPADVSAVPGTPISPIKTPGGGIDFKAFEDKGKQRLLHEYHDLRTDPAWKSKIANILGLDDGLEPYATKGAAQSITGGALRKPLFDDDEYDKMDDADDDDVEGGAFLSNAFKALATQVAKAFAKRGGKEAVKAAGKKAAKELGKKVLESAVEKGTEALASGDARKAVKAAGKAAIGTTKDIAKGKGKELKKRAGRAAQQLTAEGKKQIKEKLISETEKQLEKAGIPKGARQLAKQIGGTAGEQLLEGKAKKLSKRAREELDKQLESAASKISGKVTEYTGEEPEPKRIRKAVSHKMPTKDNPNATDNTRTAISQINANSTPDQLSRKLDREAQIDDNTPGQSNLVDAMDQEDAMETEGLASGTVPEPPAWTEALISAFRSMLSSVLGSEAGIADDLLEPAKYMATIMHNASNTALQPGQPAYMSPQPEILRQYAANRLLVGNQADGTDSQSRNLFASVLNAVGRRSARQIKNSAGLQQALASSLNIVCNQPGSPIAYPSALMQAQPQTTIYIAHNSGFSPAVVMYRSAGTATIVYDDNLTLSWNRGRLQSMTYGDIVAQLSNYFNTNAPNLNASAILNAGTAKTKNVRAKALMGGGSVQCIAKTSTKSSNLALMAPISNKKQDLTMITILDNNGQVVMDHIEIHTPGNAQKAQRNAALIASSLCLY
jgi:hypothetical protein